jgi:lipopolysaccharide/colanic/teichoic acid biosynthesis glycosyltransferase
MTTRSRAVKRGVDLAVAVPCLLLAAPVLAVVAVVIKCVSPGPVLFRQPRQGRHGETFALLKLRSMRPDAERRLQEVLVADAARADEWRRYRRLADDPRVIPGIGRWIRRLSIDEVPQLWNVIRGDMSVVGPRPMELEVAATFPVEHLRLRQQVRPGLTGLWQVSGRSEHDLGALRALDEQYLRRRSTGLDLRILAATPRTVLSRRGAY